MASFFLCLLGLEVFDNIPYFGLCVSLQEFMKYPPNNSMCRFVLDTLPRFAFIRKDILKIWYKSIISKQSEMVVDQDKGKMVRGYLSWFRDQ